MVAVKLSVLSIPPNVLISDNNELARAIWNSISSKIVLIIEH